MTADNEIDVKEAFQRSQKGHNNKAKLVASLKSRYDKVNSLRGAILFLFFFLQFRHATPLIPVCNALLFIERQ